MAGDCPKVIMLGSNDYDFHRLDDLGPILVDFLNARAGIDVELSTDRDVLLPASIDEYDVLIDYTTNGELSDDQWSGLHNFVHSGNGYVGIHGASAVYWDTDNPRTGLETLVGGAFEEHDDYTRLPVEIVDTDHEITRGVEDFSIKDEPYRCRHDDVVRILARAHHNEVGDLPIAWVKTYGDGRVFYYANGHDERAFAHPSFQQLVVNGVKWVSETI